MRVTALSLGSVIMALLVSLGVAVSASLPACSSEVLGKQCTADAQCAPLVCATPLQGGAAPVAGTCQYASGKGGLCYRDASCEAGLVCVFPDGSAPYAEGDCEPASDVD